MSAARWQHWPRLGSVGAGSTAALFLYQQVHPRPRVPAPAITLLSVSTQGFGSRNESLATSQVRQSERTGVKFVFVGERLVMAEQGGARGPAGRWAGGCVGRFWGWRRSRSGSRTGCPSRHQPRIHWKSHGPAEPVEAPPSALGERFPFPLPRSRPRGPARGHGVPHTPTAAGGVQERDVFVASGSCRTNFKRRKTN